MRIWHGVSGPRMTSHPTSGSSSSCRLRWVPTSFLQTSLCRRTAVWVLTWKGTLSQLFSRVQAFQGVFRLTLLATPSATMAGLDEVLRKTWCEPCCRGHGENLKRHDVGIPGCHVTSVPSHSSSSSAASQLLLHDVALGPPTPFVSPQSSTARPVQVRSRKDGIFWALKSFPLPSTNSLGICRVLPAHSALGTETLCGTATVCPTTHA